MPSPVIIIPEALQGSVGPISATIPSGHPQSVRLELTSPTFPTDPSLLLTIFAEESFDGGTSWILWFSLNDSQGGSAGLDIGDGVQDGIPRITVSYDGSPRLVRLSVTVNKPFVWGLTATVI